jgi:hypothetical protein
VDLRKNHLLESTLPIFLQSSVAESLGD